MTLLVTVHSDYLALTTIYKDNLETCNKLEKYISCYHRLASTYAAT